MTVIIQLIFWILVAVFCFDINKSEKPCRFRYTHYASTVKGIYDNKYVFTIEKYDGEYFCFVERHPSLRREYSPEDLHLNYDSYSERYYICWTNPITTPENAKKLCRMWAGSIQQFLDTGIPVPGFNL